MKIIDQYKLGHIYQFSVKNLDANAILEGEFCFRNYKVTFFWIHHRKLTVKPICHNRDDIIFYYTSLRETFHVVVV